MGQCKSCKRDFNPEEDKDFLARFPLEISSPSHCSDCRQIRRLAWRNERNLYRRNCDLCKKDILSIYKEDCPYTVYCLDCWWSDKWNPSDYGRDFDFSKPFFEQFHKLQCDVPHMALLQVQNENSEYTNYVSNLKDCYLLFSADYNRECMYGVSIEKCRDCVDNLIIESCELSYECVFSKDIYAGVCNYFSSNCSDSKFLFDCKNCRNCYMCHGLRDKEYHIENKKYSREEYEKIVEGFDISDRDFFDSEKKKFLQLIPDSPQLYLRRNGRIVNSTGDFLTNVENCENCYEISDSKDCKNVQGGFEIKDSRDCCFVQGEFGYENCECVPMPFSSCFNVNTYSGHDLNYTDSCMNSCHHLFGCVSLRGSNYEIFNKKYDEDEYEKLVGEIVSHMKKSGEWGEFLPMEISPFAYDETIAQEFAPRKGFAAKDTPDTVKDDLGCNECGKKFKIIEPEKRFYGKMKLPEPIKCSNCRHFERIKFRNVRILYERNCDKCGVELKSTYSNKRPEKVLCEKCYLEEVY